MSARRKASSAVLTWLAATAAALLMGAAHLLDASQVLP